MATQQSNPRRRSVLLAGCGPSSSAISSAGWSWRACAQGARAPARCRRLSA